jgi:serine/threonine-protein kinase RsbW
LASTTHTLTIPSSTRYLEDLREFVTTNARDAGFSEPEVEQLKIAVDEACTNVIEHAYGGGGEHAIDIAMIVGDDRLTVRIQDTGSSFDPETYKEPDLMQYAKMKKSGGFGVHIMRRLMDRVEFRKRGNVNECCLVKYRNNATK